MMDDHYIYVFVRQDISLPEQLVHLAHAAYHMGNLLFPVEGIPSLVIIGTPHIGALAKVERKLKENDIKFHVWADPDTQYGPTAIATEPISRAKKGCLANYRLWSHAAVAQEKEHSAFSGEVGSSTLPCGSTSINCS